MLKIGDFQHFFLIAQIVPIQNIDPYISSVDNTVQTLEFVVRKFGQY